MAVQSQIGRTSYIKLEAVEGTAETTGFKRLQTLQFIPDIETEVRTGGPANEEYDTYSQRLKEYSTVDVPETDISYTDLTYGLELSVAGGVTPSVVGTTGQSRVYAPSTTIKTATIHFGDAVENDRVAGAFLDSLTIGGTRGSGTMSASGFGRLLALNEAQPTPTTDVEQVILDPNNWAIRMADTLAGLTGASDEAEVYRVGFNLSGRWGMRWPMNPANPSYAGRVLRKPTIEANVALANDAVGRALITANLRLNTRKFFRFQNIGAAIAGGTAFNTLTIEFEGVVSAAPKRENFEDLVVLPFTLRGVRDSTLNAYRITTITSLATL